MTSYFFYYIIFIAIGMFNSILFPNFISVLGNWFSKKHRGVLIGLWATCNNTGNIVGIQLAAWLLDLFNGEWPYLFLVIAVIVFIYSALIFIFLIPEP